ncbi:MAG: N-acetylmuramoyl-L-alanine amidase [Polymorphobacter sp.]|uniref:N-acetylmuramoyl-L-alanine amidase n=1 Tax=Polymorphobacter sp. TaxID=1909290 RepID=UPI003A8633FF
MRLARPFVALMLALLVGMAPARSPLQAPLQAATLSAVSAVPALVSVVSDEPIGAGEVFALAEPDRLVIDLPATVADALSVPGAASVRQVRLAAFSPGVARLVLDLDRPVLLERARMVGPEADGTWRLELRLVRAKPSVFVDAVRAGRAPVVISRAPQRLALEELFASVADETGETTASPQITPAGEVLPKATTPVQPRPEAEAEAETAPPVVRAPERAGERAAAQAAPRQSRSGGKPLVVVDAGHGGKDVGAISVRGGYEKDVTLAIAREVARELERRGRVRVRLTRADDRFIPLGGRVRIAQAARADLFISIHADAALNREARGASVYTLSSRASDEVAARLAARENKADIIGGINLGAEAPDVSDVLIELSRRGTTDMSVIFAQVLQDELSPRIRFRSTFHHFAGFRVLKAPDVPSVLLETGYVSNGEDADFLFSRTGQKRIAEGIARAIEKHLLGS